MHHDANQSEQIKQVAELIKGIKVAMMTTVNPDGSLHSRPMVVQDQDFSGDLWFLTGKDTLKTDEIAKNPQVNVAFSDPDDNRFVSVSGKARVVQDKAKLDELWNPAMKAWFPKGKDDPNIALIQVDPTLAEYWDAANSKVVQLIGFVKAIASGERYEGEASDHGSVRL